MAPKIQPGDQVLVRYRVFAGKEMVDAAEEPVKLEIGSGRFMPAVEMALVGHQPGEKIVVLVPPEEHYGPYDPKKLQIVASEKIPPNANPGEVVKVQDELGVVYPAILRKKDEEIALVDLNHPLAGKVLRFEVEILDVKPKEEQVLPGESAAETLQEGREER